MQLAGIRGELFLQNVQQRGQVISGDSWNKFGVAIPLIVPTLVHELAKELIQVHELRPKVVGGGGLPYLGQGDLFSNYRPVKLHYKLKYGGGLSANLLQQHGKRCIGGQGQIGRILLVFP